ncbi:hypothetical protein ABZ832_02715 [Streptantibioticus parmotrematis]|uniref:hypothetical protein n=1 Tax=Streptantibioticus parmotrematis TaxID=2873249 RepID=UPI0033F8AF65
MSQRTPATSTTSRRRRTAGLLAALSALAGLGLTACGAHDGAPAARISASSVADTASGPASAPTGVPTVPRRTAEGRTTTPPWPVPADPAARVAAAGLPMMGAEGQVMHIHAHLDVLVDGKPVVVPALIGIDEQAQRISPLHTHDTSGVIHIESPVKAVFTLGQFMTEWDVALDAGRLGGLTTGHGDTLRAYVDGHEIKGDPAALTLHAHDEIALVYGPADTPVKVPGSYTWPQGL